MNDPVSTAAPKRRRWGTLLAIIAACACLFGGMLLLMPSAPTVAPQITQSAATKAAAISTPSIRPTEVTTPSVSPIVTTQPLPPKVVIPPAAEPRRVQLPAAQIDIAVTRLPDESLNGTTVTPPEDPNFTYWISQYGLAGEGAKDTVVIAAHSGLDNKWVFNRLSDATLVKVGDLIIVTTDAGTLTYRITIVDQLARADVAGSSYISQPHPDELVLISCFTADLHNQNRLVVATLVR